MKLVIYRNILIFSLDDSERNAYVYGPTFGIEKEELSKLIPKILEKVGLKGEENAKVSTFSGGMKQRLGIAQALLHKPSLIVMDEPVSALDPIGRREVLNLIEEIKRYNDSIINPYIKRCRRNL